MLERRRGTLVADLYQPDFSVAWLQNFKLYLTLGFNWRTSSPKYVTSKRSQCHSILRLNWRLTLHNDRKLHAAYRMLCAVRNCWQLISFTCCSTWQSCYRDLTIGLGFKTRTLPCDLETKIAHLRLQIQIKRLLSTTSGGIVNNK